MTEEIQRGPRQRGKLWLATGLVGLVLALVIVPPFIGISRYKHRITQLVSAALGRPVRLSGVELRLLPRPGFVLTDLTVEEDPAYGTEPVLHANTVDASVRFASLWRGQLQISRISVDEASLNLVRAADGRWNLDSLFRNAAASTHQRRAVPRPYLEATNSRINIKNGLEKLPYSLLDADAALWQESDGTWRVRLEGQPARTDVSLDLADTGIVSLDGTLRPATPSNKMPLHLDAEWRDAQLGQLSRLLLGSDEGWRGDLRGELHLDGTAASAHVQASLRATGVHREEFAPAAPLDFDAACTLVLHYASRSVENLDCSSPVGDGHARLRGSIPSDRPLRLALDLDRIPAQAGLDVLRTLRNQVDPSLQAAGRLSGHLIYDPAAASATPAPQSHKAGIRPPARRPPAGPLTGGLTLERLSLTGDSLARPITVARMSLEPATPQPDEQAALSSSFTIPAGGPGPLSVRVRLALAGFQLGLRGPVSIARLREFAHFTGAAVEPALRQLAGEPANVDLVLSGPWMAPVEVTLGAPGPPLARSVYANGIVSFRDANWKSSFLTNAVLIHQAALHVDNGAYRWDPVDFSYGPVEGSATLSLPAPCAPPAECGPRFTAHFAVLDTAEIQVALLGARRKGTLLSSLLARFNPSASPTWPAAEGLLQADSVNLGPFVLTGVSANLKVAGTGAELTSFDASMLGGNVNGTATLQVGDKPQYTIAAAFTGLKPAMVGSLLAMKWSGNTFSGSGKLQMSGFTARDLAESAAGTFQFDWRKGGIKSTNAPPVLAAFDRFSGKAVIGDGALSLTQDTVLRGAKSTTVKAEANLAVPHKVSVSVSKR